MPSAETNGSNGHSILATKSQTIGGHPEARTQLTKPLVYSGTLDRFAHRELTPAIGREYEGLQVTELLAMHNEELIKDLAVTGMSLERKETVTELTNISITTWCRLSQEARSDTTANERTHGENHQSRRQCTFPQPLHPNPLPLP
jgi:hypothetical protein